MAAVAFITPGLAVAVLYLFPLMVLAFESIGQRRLPSLMTFLSFTIALMGIITCLGLTSVSMDWRGIGFGLDGGIGHGRIFVVIVQIIRRRVWLSPPCLGECLCHAGGTCSGGCRPGGS